MEIKENASPGKEEALEIVNDIRHEDNHNVVLSPNDWRYYQVTSELAPQQEILVSFGNVAVVVEGDITVITGPKKARKTLLAALIMSQVCGKVIVIDTEQSRYHAMKLKQRIEHLKQDNCEVITLSLRGLSMELKRKIIKDSIEANPDVRAMLIDNVRDLLHDINDSEQSHLVLGLLEEITMKFKIGLVCTIHSNRSNGRLRGHLGVELENKAYMVIKAQNKGWASSISCECSRELDFSPFMLRHDAETGAPEIVVDDMDAQMRAKMRELIGNQKPKYNELLQLVMAGFQTNGQACSELKAKALIREANDKRWIRKVGRDRSPNTYYEKVNEREFDFSLIQAESD